MKRSSVFISLDHKVRAPRPCCVGRDLHSLKGWVHVAFLFLGDPTTQARGNLFWGG